MPDLVLEGMKNERMKNDPCPMDFLQIIQKGRGKSGIQSLSSILSFESSSPLIKQFNFAP